MTPHRQERVADVIRLALAKALREDVHDPRIGFVTITGVDLSPDLRNARVLVSTLDPAVRRDETMGALRHAAPFLRRALAREASLRRIPRLSFEFDETLETGSRVEELLRGLRGPPDEGGS